MNRFFSALLFILTLICSCEDKPSKKVEEQQSGIPTSEERVRIVTINGHRYLKTIGGMAIPSYQHEASCEMHDMDSIMNKNRHK